LGPGSTLNLKVTGVGGVPSSGVSAVVLNTTVTAPTTTSFLTVWPAGQTRPNASNINFNTGKTLPNLVTVKVGSNGQVSFFNAAGFVHVLADVAGYYVDSTGPPGSTFVPVSPVRLLDTRSNGGAFGGIRSSPLQVTGGIVPSTATGVVVNVTVTGPTASSFVTVYPANLTSVPNVSNLNFSKGETIPNLVSVQLGQIGTSAQKGINFFNAGGTVQVIVDLEGYYAPGNASGLGSRFFPVVDHRILDTRSNIGGVPPGPISAGTPISVPIVGQGGVLDGASAVVMNTTITAPTASGFLTVFPANLMSPPNVSNLNFTAGETIANLVSVATGLNPALGRDKFANASGSVQAIGDVVGWYGPPGN
jgi:hypothetical protein